MIGDRRSAIGDRQIVDRQIGDRRSAIGKSLIGKSAIGKSAIGKSAFGMRLREWCRIHDRGSGPLKTRPPISGQR
jgi:hypothetical protein